MQNLSTISQYPLRKPVRVVAGQWRFVDAEAFQSHIKSFAETAERNTSQAHSVEFNDIFVASCSLNRYHIKIPQLR